MPPRHRHAQILSPALPRTVAGVTMTSAQGCQIRPRSTKKQQSGQLMGVRIEGRVMVHRTDIAGGSTGQTSLGHDRMCCPVLKRRPSRKQSFARFSLSRQDSCRLRATAVTPVHAIYLELPTL